MSKANELLSLTANVGVIAPTDLSPGEKVLLKEKN